MTYPPQPTAGPGDYLAMLAAYAVGLAPGFALDAWTPAGEHLSWIPALLGVLAGLPCGLALASLARLFVRKPAHRQLSALLIVIYSLAWTGPAIIRYANKALDDGPRVAHTLTVLELARPSKGPNRMTVEHWEAGAAPFTVNGSLEPGETLSLYSHAGKLGFAWVELPGDAYQNERRGLLR
ncbi:MAG TPA: hypothetical protein VD886_05210 [Herpetosiphonaceae bacterium]|nr:hypothetical protein [Herpetosiphonaceae bacterium]